jgi:hypothetical protein
MVSSVKTPMLAEKCWEKVCSEVCGYVYACTMSFAIMSELPISVSVDLVFRRAKWATLVSQGAAIVLVSPHTNCSSLLGMNKLSKTPTVCRLPS